MIHLGLIGYLLEHSLSPKIHSAALKVCGLQGDYSLFPIHLDDLRGMKDLLDCVRSGQITGVNVTIPHKQNVIQFLDELTDTAESIDAVNTIYLRDGKLVGDNTDAAGFLIDLKRFFVSSQSKIENQKSAIVLGAGGSARAIVYALLNDGWKVAIAARRIEQAWQLAAQFGIHAVEFNLQTFQPSNIQLIVNTTPLGMTPNVDQSPWPEDLPFPSKAAVYDLVYNPRETRLVKDACSAGLPATTGLGMLVEQAALSFGIWTGCNLPRNTLLESINY